MNNLNETDKVNHDVAQFVVLGTLLSGVIEHGEAIECARAVQEAGGAELFDAEWSKELWWRAEKGLKEGWHPKTYKNEMQVNDVPMEVLVRCFDEGMDKAWVESKCLPELIEAARQRRIRRAMRQAAAGGDIDAALKSIRADKPWRVRPKTNLELCNEATEMWENASRHPHEISGISSGLTGLDRLTWGWQKKNLIIIGARPSHGKTAILMGFARTAAIENNIPTLFMTLESSPEELMRRLACQIAEADQQALRGGYASANDLQRLTVAMGKIHKAPFHFLDCSGWNINRMRSEARQYKNDYGIGLIVADYLQKVKATEKHEKRTYEVAQASEGLKEMAKENDVPVISAAQLNREPDKQKGRAPALSDLADSGQIERDADLVGLLHRDTEGKMYVLLAKHRDGPTGIVEVEFMKQCAKYCNAIKIEYEERQHKND
jgi:replicative DNA helicase